jgi:hypothetical protein
MRFDLNSLLQPLNDLEDLVNPFITEEVDAAVRNLKADKSPDPDGFHTDFMKKCWEVIKYDFYDLCTCFFNHDICLQGINGSYITLIPKVDNPSKVGDFRPISLLDNFVKLLTKLRSIHQNQYDFIKGRSIQDCLAWAFEYLHLCHKCRKELLILKLDFEKAFDKVEHEVIIQVLRQKGFPRKWVKWINEILSLGTSFVLHNGVLGKVFHYRRGIRQGDSLSPLLFVLTPDLLQSSVNKAKDMGLLKVPINMGYTTNFPIIQYADDTLLIMKACPQ